MGDVSKEGRTVLFVSHNMNAVEQLCKRGILLEYGSLYQASSDVRDLIKLYLYGQGGLDNPSEWISSDKHYENPWFQPARFSIFDGAGNRLAMPIRNTDDAYVFIEGRINAGDPSLQIGYALYNDEGALIYWSCHNDTAESDWPSLKKGNVLLRSRIPSRLLNEGIYRIELLVALYYRQWICEPGRNSPAVFMTIKGGLSDSPYWSGRRPGFLAPVIKWELVD